MAQVASSPEDPYGGLRFRLSEKILGVTFLSVPITKMNVYWGLHWGPPICKLLYYVCIAHGGFFS